MTATAPRIQTASAPALAQLARTERPAAATAPQPSFWLVLLRALAAAAA
jgi:hypothetical protein